MKKEPKIYCEECSSEDKVRLAKYQCSEGCGYGVCEKHEREAMGECGQCQPMLVLIKSKRNTKDK
jgi:hypothetical protein